LERGEGEKGEEDAGLNRHRGVPHLGSRVMGERARSMATVSSEE
jgi:hypothetical protein